MRKTILTLFGLMMLFLAPALAAAQGRFTQAPVPALTLGTTPGTAFDGAQGAAAQNNASTALTNASTANSGLASLNGQLNANLSSSVIPKCGNYQGSGWCGWEANVPLVVWNVSGTSPQFAGFDIVFDQTAVTGNNNVAAINVATNVGANDPGQVVGVQSIIKSASTIGGSNVLAGQFITYRQPGNGSTGWPLLTALHDQSGTDSSSSTGGDIDQENALTASLGDDQNNLSMYGNHGVRWMSHDSFNIETNATNSFQGSVSGTTLTTNSVQNLLPGMIPTGSPTAFVAGTSILSGSGNSFQLSHSQTIATENMTAAPPVASSAFFAAGMVMDTGTGAGVGSFYGFANGPAHTGSHGWNGFDCAQVQPLAPLTQFNCVAASSNQNFELDRDGANTSDAGTPSLSSPPHRAISYNSALGWLQYFIKDVGVALTIADNGLLTAYFGLTVNGALTANGPLSAAGTISTNGNNSVTAAGSTLTTSFQLSLMNNVIRSGAAGTGVCLPLAEPVWTEVDVYNRSGSPKVVYPCDSSGTLESGTVGAGVTMQSGTEIYFKKDSSTDWLE